MFNSTKVPYSLELALIAVWYRSTVQNQVIEMQCCISKTGFVLLKKHQKSAPVMQIFPELPTKLHNVVHENVTDKQAALTFLDWIMKLAVFQQQAMVSGGYRYLQPHLTCMRGDAIHHLIVFCPLYE